MEYSSVGTGFRIIILLLLVAVLALGGLVWFDYLGIVDAQGLLSPVFTLIRGEKVVVDAEDPLLLEKERLTKQLEALAIRSEELTSWEQELESRQAEINQMVEQLEERERGIEDREKVFNERLQAFENRRVNLRQNSDYLVGMPPENAVKILLQMEDQDVIDIFRVTEEQAQAAGEVSLVSYWLSLMPADRAAVLQRKMSRKTGG
ncbi:MAG: flagellar protein FlbB [Spirochaetaceae bacterium]|nr:MAG: flagellar protein FlbB [Spirochaetaceae bacterium]